MIGTESHRQQQYGNPSDDYHAVFLVHVHQLIHLGYGKLKSCNYSTEEEPAITGDLVEQIDKVLDCQKYGWMKYYSVHDDPGVNDGTRKGKNRRRIDIRFDSSLQTPRARFSLEAKRLSKTHRTSTYLGDDGLGCFLSGHYAANEDTAGMLGYIQSGSASSWSKKIEKLLAEKATEYSVCKGTSWQRYSLQNGPRHTYGSSHTRRNGHGNIHIYHTLLIFL